MDAFEETLADIDRQIAEFKKGGLVETADLLSRFKAAILSGPTDASGMVALLAGTVEKLERRIVDIESREV